MTATESKRVVKALDARVLRSSVAFNFDDFRKQCDKYLENIRAAAQRVVNDAHADAETIRRKAFDQAKADGLSEAMKEAEAHIEERATELAERKADEKLQSLFPAMQNASESLEREYERWLNHWEAAAIHLSAAIAEKVIGRQLKTQPEVAHHMITQALKLVSNIDRVTVYLNPQDLDDLGDRAGDFVRAVSRAQDVTCVPDESMTTGGCRIETQHGTIDAQVETLLARIASELIQNDDDDVNS